MAATNCQNVVGRLRVEPLDDESEPLGGHGLMVTYTVETDVVVSPRRRDDPTMDSPVTLQAALDSIDEPWKPLTVAVVNDYDVRVVKVRGEFTWHSHPETDELFHVLSGSLTRSRWPRATSTSAPVTSTSSTRPPAPPPLSGWRDGAAVRAEHATVNTGDTPSRLTTKRRVATA